MRDGPQGNGGRRKAVLLQLRASPPSPIGPSSRPCRRWRRLHCRSIRRLRSAAPWLSPQDQPEVPLELQGQLRGQAPPPPGSRPCSLVAVDSASIRLIWQAYWAKTLRSVSVSRYSTPARLRRHWQCPSHAEEEAQIIAHHLGKQDLWQGPLYCAASLQRTCRELQHHRMRMRQQSGDNFSSSLAVAREMRKGGQANIWVDLSFSTARNAGPTES